MTAGCTSEFAADLVAAGIAQPHASRLARFAADLAEANAGVNLTAARTREAIVDHVVDSLTLLPLVTGRLVDVGSGGGFPGIPLALAAGVETTLIEAIAKKAAFLRREADRLDAPITVIAERAETIGRDLVYRERFRTATARAVGSATETLELLLPLLEVGGRALLQRGRPEGNEAAAIDDAALMLGGRVTEIRAAGGERRIIVVEKIGETPARFPRRAGIPKKRPLRAGAV